jgi:tripartite-type tricarboxylate transporter receptor subunit TctC
MKRRHLLALPALLATPASAQSRPIRLIVPFIAGSAPDVIARQLSERLPAALGAPVVIENRPGAGGNIGFEYVARTQHDAPVLMLGTNSLVINPALHRNPLRFDAFRDFVPVNLAVAMPHVLIVPSNGPADVAALLASLRAQPEQNYASGGNGSGAHLAAEMFRERAGVRVTHVPFRGAPDIVNAVMAGTVSFGFPTLATATELVRAGRLRALAVTSPARNHALPAVPALAETLPGFDLVSWFALLASSGASPDFVRRVDEAVRAAFADAAFRDRVQADGSVGVAMPGAAFAEFLRAEQVKWTEAVRLSGAQVD